MTLIELVAGLGLLASLLTAMLIARGKYLRQSRTAERREQAVAAADALLSQWWTNPATFPRSAAGTLPGGMTWRTTPAPNPPVESLGGQVVRLTVRDGGESSSPSLVSVDVVLASSKEEAAKTRGR